MLGMAIRVLFAVILTALTSVAAACALPGYNLPIPFRLYALGATGALALSFVTVGYLVNARTARSIGGKVSNLEGYSVFTESVIGDLIGVLRVISVCGLLLSIATGFFGSPVPVANFNVTFFFVIFVLGLAYATAVIGDIYQLINPWRTICGWIERRTPGAFRGRYRYPGWLSYYPALVLYMAFIWVELFANISPRELSVILLVYSAINLAGVWVFGTAIWFERGEFFSVFFRIIGKIAPLDYVRSSSTVTGFRIEARMPFVGLLRKGATEFSLLLFVLFMLSSTAIDGAHETLPWVDLFWKGIYPLLGIGAGTQQQDLLSLQAYYGWQWLMLFVSPGFYLAVYIVFIYAAKIMAGSSEPLRSLLLRFAFTLVPIAFVYNVTHYFTLLLSQGFQIGRMVSDPFNRGWNLFGTARWGSDPFIPSASVVWHTQVGLILIGHVISVYLAHVEALKVFPSSRKAVMSQVPMLVLMMVFTTTGLWILSLPISGGQVAEGAAVVASGLSR
jgi:hypothetical protein